MNRGRLYSSIERVERTHSRGFGERPSKPQPVAQPPRQKTLIAPPTAIATAAKRAQRAKQARAVPTAHDPKGTVQLTAKALKAVLTLDPAVVAAIELRDNAPAPPFVVAVDGRRLRSQVTAKSLRKVLAMIAEHGPDRVAVTLQGRLAGDAVIDAGVIAQVREPKAAP